MFQRRPRRFRHRSNGRNNQHRGMRDGQTKMRTNSFTSINSRNSHRSNQSAEKLLEKYNVLAKEALSSGDKILSENYLQHADHFQRVLNERESFKREKYLENKIDHNPGSSDETLDLDENTEKKISEVSEKENKEKKYAKTVLNNN